jgi:hypothetical protein
VAVLYKRCALVTVIGEFEMLCRVLSRAREHPVKAALF